jgi:hypothetical protein
MSYDNFVFAQFLLMRRKRDFLYGFLISLWLGSAAFMHQAPLLMACAIGAGVYAFLHLLIDLYRCDSAWAGLWETLVTRARSAREGGCRMRCGNYDIQSTKARLWSILNQ